MTHKRRKWRALFELTWSTLTMLMCSSLLGTMVWGNHPGGFQWMTFTFLSFGIYGASVQARNAAQAYFLRSFPGATSSKTPRAHRHRSLAPLRWFYWFCSKENREHIELVKCDLAKDARGMRREGYGRFYVSLVLIWHSVVSTILPICVDAVRRGLAALIPIGRLYGYFKGFWLH